MIDQSSQRRKTLQIKIIAKKRWLTLPEKRQLETEEENCTGEQSIFLFTSKSDTVVSEMIQGETTSADISLNVKCKKNSHKHNNGSLFFLF